MDEIRQRIVNGFAINRIPPKTQKAFIEFAKEEFCDDRGMALKFLWDFYAGLIPSGIEHLEAEIMALKQEVASLKEQPKQEEKKVRKSLDGRMIRGK